jgi:hypothetical protein
MSTLVACGMEDENNKIGQAYQRYANFCKGIRIKPLSEYQWINTVVTGDYLSNDSFGRYK